MTTTVFNRFKPNDRQTFNAEALKILHEVEQLLAKGHTFAIAVVVLADGPKNIDMFSRCLIPPHQLDLVDDGFRGLLSGVEQEAGVKIADVRAARERFEQDLAETQLAGMKTEGSA